MAIPTLAGPRVQGRFFDFSACEIFVEPIGMSMNITDISYSQKLDPGIFRGSGAKIRGRTRGTYDAEGSFTIYKEDYEVLKYMLMAKSKGAGYMTAVFGITVMYREQGYDKTIVDELRGCRIVSEDNSLASGNNTTVVKVGLSVMEIIANGVQAVTGRPGGKLSQI